MKTLVEQASERDISFSAGDSIKYLREKGFDIPMYIPEDYFVAADVPGQEIWCHQFGRPTGWHFIGESGNSIFEHYLAVMDKFPTLDADSQKDAAEYLFLTIATARANNPRLHRTLLLFFFPVMKRQFDKINITDIVNATNPGVPLEDPDMSFERAT